MDILNEFWDFMITECIAERKEYTEHEQKQVLYQFLLDYNSRYVPENECSKSNKPLKMHIRPENA